MFLEKQQYINSKLFGELYNGSESGLLACYIMLLYNRNGYHCYLPIKNSNGKLTIGNRLISKQSGVSLTALDKYMPELIRLGLCDYMLCGGIIMTGSKKIDKKYKSSKKVPVRIGHNLRETKGNVFMVPLTANLYRQMGQIDKKITLNKALRRVEKGLPVSAELHKLIKSFLKKDCELKKVENIVLSNKGINNVITGSTTDGGHNAVAKGGYWRKVAQERGFIYSRRRYKQLWHKQISYSEFLNMKSYFQEKYGFVTYKNGRVVKPICSEVLLTHCNIIASTYNTTTILDKYIKDCESRKQSPARS
jgi:hypothetical protein